MRLLFYASALVLIATQAQASFNQMQICKAAVSASYAGLVEVSQLTAGADGTDEIITRHTDDAGGTRTNKCKFDGNKVYIHNGKRWTYMEDISMTYAITGGRLTVKVNHPVMPTTMVWSDKGFKLVEGP